MTLCRAVTRWQDDKVLLGSKPVRPVNVAEVTEKDGNYSVPLAVRGSENRSVTPLISIVRRRP